jgi:hypothetical protein
MIEIVFGRGWFVGFQRPQRRESGRNRKAEDDLDFAACLRPVDIRPGVDPLKYFS